MKIEITGELSLLVIDLEYSCVIKLEEGEPFQINNGTDWWIDALPKPQICHRPFTELRAAIDGPDKPPVPRIERSNSDNIGAPYALFSQPDISTALTEREFDAIIKLAGKRLPIYEPKKGEWTELTNFGDGEKAVGYVWRYTR